MTTKFSQDVAAALAAFFRGGSGPTHAELTELFAAAQALHLDPYKAKEARAASGFSNGAFGTPSKEVRVRAVLSALCSADVPQTEGLLQQLLARMRVRGCFNDKASGDAVATAQRVFERCGWHLDADGHLTPLVIDEVDRSRRRPVLEAQIERMRRAGGDAALLMGTAKELLESTARYVLEELEVPMRRNAEFSELLYMARERLGLLPQQVGEPVPAARTVREVFDGLWRVAKAVNDLRNLEGTGHGRTRLPGVPPETARAVVRAAGLLCELMLETVDASLGRRAESA